MSRFVFSTASSFVVAFSIVSLNYSVPVWAQEVNDNLNISLDEILVTSELLERSLKKTGNSVVVLDQKDLEEKAGLTTVRNVLEDTANISVIHGTGKAPTIRGIDGTGPAEGANAFFAGSRARLNWQIDGRPVGYNEIVWSDLGIWDIDRIEVLRGPQSTLVGRNSIAGTVIINTNDPTFEKEGALQAAGGNYDQRRVSAMINAPIVDNKLAMRLTADWNKKSSSINYEPFLNVNEPADIEALSLRGKVLIKPKIGEGTQLLLTLAHQEHKGPAGEIVVQPFKDRISNALQQPVHKLTSNVIGADFETLVSDNLKLELNASVTNFQFKRYSTTSSATLDKDEFIIEPRLRYKNSSGYEGVVGVYYYHSEQDEYLRFFVDNYFEDKADTVAVYAEGVIPLADTIDLSAGLRYEREERKRTGGDAGATFVDLNQDDTFEAFLPKLGINWSPNETFSWGAQVSRGYNAGGGGVASNFPNPGPALVGYEYEAEYVWTYELYGRQSFNENRIQTTQNIFFSDYKDMQLPFDLTPLDSRDEAFVVRNADRVITYGAEFGIKAMLTDTITVDGGLGLLWTDIVDYPNSAVEGNELFTAPNITANLGVTWKEGNWLVNATARYSDEYFTDINNRPGGKTDPRVIADAKVAYTYKNFEIFGTVSNIFDTEKPLALYPGATPSLDTAVLTQPRTFLIGVKTVY